MKPPALRVRQACDRHALMRAAMNRLQISTGRPPPVTFFVGELSSLPSQTPATRSRGVADEPGVAVILGGAGLAGGRPAGQRRLVARCRSASVSCIMAFIIATMRGVDDAAEPVRLPRVEHLAVARADLARSTCGDDAEAAIGERRIGADQLEQRHFRGAERDRRRWRSSSEAMPSRCAVRTTFVGPTSSAEPHRHGVERLRQRRASASPGRDIRGCSSPAASP